MNADISYWPLKQRTVQAILNFQKTPAETLDDVLSKILVQVQEKPEVSPARIREKSRLGANGKCSYVLFGEEYLVNSGREVLTSVLRCLHDLDETVLNRLSFETGRTRRLVARSPEQIYPGRPDLANYAHHVDGGWWVGTNYSHRDIERILKVVCEVADIGWGKDLVVNLG